MDDWWCLRQGIFVSFDVLVEQFAALLVERQALHGQGGIELGASAVEPDPVDLRELSGGELAVFGILLDRGRIEDVLCIAERFRVFVCGVGGQLFRAASFLVHYEDVEITVPVGSEHDLAAVRRPDRARVVSRMGC